MFAELLKLLTLLQVHKGPQVNPTTSSFPLNNNNNKLINEAGSLCSSDSVEEENKIDEQSGRPIQCQIPQSQRGKVKTVLVENNLSTLSASGANIMWFPLVYQKLHQYLVIL